MNFQANLSYVVNSCLKIQLVSQLEIENACKNRVCQKKSGVSFKIMLQSKQKNK